MPPACRNDLSEAPLPADLPDNNSPSVREVVSVLHEDLWNRDDDDGTPVVVHELPVPSPDDGGAAVAEEAEEAPFKLHTLTVKDVNDAGSRLHMLLHPSSLLPHATPLPPSPLVIGTAPDGSPLVDHDPGSELVRRFLPPEAPAERDALIRYAVTSGRRFAFCLALYQRAVDAFVDLETGRAVPEAERHLYRDPSEAPAEEGGDTRRPMLKRIGSRFASVRIEAVYELDREEEEEEGRELVMEDISSGGGVEALGGGDELPPTLPV
jgi:hypothetical protein